MPRRRRRSANVQRTERPRHTSGQRIRQMVTTRYEDEIRADMPLQNAAAQTGKHLGIRFTTTKPMLTRELQQHITTPVFRPPRLTHEVYGLPR
jgi:hypothetical protein